MQLAAILALLMLGPGPGTGPEEKLEFENPFVRVFRVSKPAIPVELGFRETDKQEVVDVPVNDTLAFRVYLRTDPMRQLQADLSDLAAVDQQHVTVALDNPRVRVLRVKLNPREETASVNMVRPRLFVALTPLQLRTTTDGRPDQEMRGPAGRLMFDPMAKTGVSLSNVAPSSIEFFIVEVKQDARP